MSSFSKLIVYPFFELVTITPLNELVTTNMPIMTHMLSAIMLVILVFLKIGPCSALRQVKNNTEIKSHVLSIVRLLWNSIALNLIAVCKFALHVPRFRDFENSRILKRAHVVSRHCLLYTLLVPNIPPCLILVVQPIFHNGNIWSVICVLKVCSVFYLTGRAI